MADAVMRALRTEFGSILAFLPGQSEIRRVEERLKERISDPAIVLAPLYGAMDMKAQDLALKPGFSGGPLPARLSRGVACRGRVAGRATG